MPKMGKPWQPANSAIRGSTKNLETKTSWIAVPLAKKVPWPLEHHGRFKAFHIVVMGQGLSNPRRGLKAALLAASLVVGSQMPRAHRRARNVRATQKLTRGAHPRPTAAAFACNATTLRIFLPSFYHS